MRGTRGDRLGIQTLAAIHRHRRRRNWSRLVPRHEGANPFRELVSAPLLPRVCRARAPLRVAFILPHNVVARARFDDLLDRGLLVAGEHEEQGAPSRFRTASYSA